jgi:hypothetical protein
MTDLLQELLESHSSRFNDAVESLFNTLFEAAGPTSHDAVEMLQNKVGENINKTDGSEIVGLAAQAGMGDDPLPNEMDQIINSINNDKAKQFDLPDLPNENDMLGLPDGGGVDELPTEDGMNEPDVSNEIPDFEETHKDISDNPPPADFELPPFDESGSDEG